VRRQTAVAVFAGDQVVADFRAMTYRSYDRSNAGFENYEDAEPLNARVRAAAARLILGFSEGTGLTAGS
jgi:hypothetical protein